MFSSPLPFFVAVSVAIAHSSSCNNVAVVVAVAVVAVATAIAPSSSCNNMAVAVVAAIGTSS